MGCAENKDKLQLVKSLLNEYEESLEFVYLNTEKII